MKLKYIFVFALILFSSHPTYAGRKKHLNSILSNFSRLEFHTDGLTPEDISASIKATLGLRYLEQPDQFKSMVLLRDEELITLINSNSGKPKIEVGACNRP